MKNEIDLEQIINIKVSQFFEYINSPIIQDYYISKLENWDALCGSLHILQDLQRAKKEYFELKTINHLEAIGIMQTLYIEQDTVCTLKKALLEIKDEKFNLIKYNDIRDIRNQIFGHPSNKRSGKLSTRHFFDIIDNEQHIIKHIYWGEENGIDSEQFVLREIVIMNSKITIDYLEDLKIDLIKKITKMKEGYNIKFDNIFNDVNYTFQKLLSSKHDSVVIIPYQKSILCEFDKIRSGLVERNIYKDDYEKELKVLEFLNSKLNELFYIQTYKDIEFYTYASTLIERIKQFRELLINLDNSLIPR